MDYRKRLIEVDLPIKRISAHARREKSIRHGHISTLHIWWARRPLAACRAVICAALWPDPADPICPQSFRGAAARLISEFAGKVYGTAALHATASRESFGQWEGIVKAQEQGIAFDTHDPAHLNKLRFALLDFIADFANWDNSTVPAYLETARSLTAAAHEALGGEPGTRPLVVDPFAGGGSIPLEALRVGADVFASDLNPVAVLLNKVLLEYIPKYDQRLADEVRKWGSWIKEQAEKELAEFYPKDPDGATPIAYLWARTIRCEGPGCGAEVPLIRSLWLAKKANRSVALQLAPNKQAKRVDFKIIVNHSAGWVNHGDPKEKIADPRFDGTVKRGSATCPCCGYTTPVARAREQLKERRGGVTQPTLFCVVASTNSNGESIYRPPTPNDLKLCARATRELTNRSSDHPAGLALVPDETLPIMSGVFNAPIYGHSTWGSLYTDRQALMLTTYARLVRETSFTGLGTDLSKVTRVLLALTVSKMTDFNSNLCVWRTARTCVAHTFGRQALPMVWDFGEMNPFAGSAGDISEALDYLIRLIQHVGQSLDSTGHCEGADAGASPLPSDSAALVATDPPYYNAVPYADLSDYFYVWLRRMLIQVLTQEFKEPLSPKAREICEMAGWDPNRYAEKNGAWFERRMAEALTEARRVASPEALGLVVFAHKTTTGWESQLHAMIQAGWIITGSWPIDTERSGRLRAHESAALASSVHLVCRPREYPDGSMRTGEIGDWRDVLTDLPRRIHEWMPRLAAEGVVGADAIFACVGPALEIFSRFARVERADGSPVTLREYLEEVWAAVAKEALSLLFKGADASGLEPDARLTAMWLWTLRTDGSGTNGDPSAEDESEDSTAAETEDEEIPTPSSKGGGYTLEFDAARKIAQGLGADLDALQTVVEVKGQTARLRTVSEREAFLFARQGSPTLAGQPSQPVEVGPAPRRGKSKRPARGQQSFAVTEGDRLTAEPALSREARADISPASETPANWTTAETVLDRVHQAMLLFAKGRSDALKRFLVDDAIGKEARFWKLAQSLSALYPPGTDEKRWVDGVLARKKGLGF